KGVAAGCVGSARERRFAKKAQALADARERLAALRVTPTEARRHGIAVNRDGIRRSAADLLRYPGVDLARLASIWPELATVPADVAEQAEIDARYAGYVERQAADIRAFRRDESLMLPPDLDYGTVGSLSTEGRQRLEATRPATLGAAARVPGVTPAALVALLRHVRRRDDRLSA
ncbi:MAG: tRNA uridine-5-carboxymethylaminomethyl(34) synthesis enzyme MnmG, partial [Alphaproteobacteria bacterium]